MSALGQKAICCLKLAASEDSLTWHRRYDAACILYSQKAVDKKMEDLVGKGYLDCGVSARMGWLTDKGLAALEYAE